MAITPNDPANFSPTLQGYTGQGSFRFWCQTVLPLVYDDSLSYYELLNKVVNYLNNVISDVSQVETNVGEIVESYNDLEAYVNSNYLQLVETYNQLENYVNDYFENLDVQNEINNKLDEMASSGALSVLIAPIVPQLVADWLAENITPTTPAVDATLSVQGAAADAKKTGEMVAPVFDPSANYVAGDYVNYGGTIYVFSQNHNAGAWTGADVIAVKIGEEITGLNDLLNIYCGKTNTLVFSVSTNKYEVKEVFIKKGTRLSFSGGTNDSAIRLSIYWSDGTYQHDIPLFTGLNYRTEKDIVKLRVYNGLSTTQTYTCNLHYDELKLTNYFNKNTIIPGHITGSSILEGYYHSEYIKVALGDYLICPTYPGTFGNSRIYFYDENYNYMGYISGVIREDGMYGFSLPLSSIGNNWVNGKIYYCSFNMSEIAAQTAKFYINKKPNLNLEYGQVEPQEYYYFNEQQKEYIDSKETNADNYTDNRFSEIVTHEISKNKFNPNDELTEFNTFWQRGKVTLNDYFTTNPIPVSVGDVVLSNAQTSNLYNNYGAYCTEDKTYVSMLNQNNCTIDENGYIRHVVTRNGYVSLNAGMSYLQLLMVVVNESMPTTYEQFKDEYIFSNKVVVSAENESVLNNKRIAYNGDSICESRLTTGTAYNGGAYAKIIADTVGGSYENRAISGGILASQPGDGGSTPARCVVSDVQNMTNDADLICFEGGINDYWRNVPLGDYTENSYTNTLDTTTICGALESIFRQATQKWVGKPIVFIIVHKITSTVYTQNTAGYTFAEVREKMIGICNKYAIPFYDAFSESGLNAYNSVQNTNFLTSNSSGNPDGCHPNEAGYRRYYVPQLISLFESLMPVLEQS